MPRQDETFRTDLMRLIAAEAWVSLSLQAAQAMFGRGYPALSLAEQAAVDNWVWATVAARFLRATPELFQPQTASGPLGFQGPSTPTPSESGS